MIAVHLMPSCLLIPGTTFQRWDRGGAKIAIQFNAKNPLPTRLDPYRRRLGELDRLISRRAQRAIHQTRNATTYPPSGVSGAM
jgi:hypothetical protein